MGSPLRGCLFLVGMGRFGTTDHRATQGAPFYTKLR
jgi:hypothetical protein